MGNIQVHHITPGRSDKNFGRSINQLIENLSDEDWICLRDIDTMPLHHRVFFKQCEEIANSNKFDLVGCMTNRLGLTYQLHDERISENFDIKHHIEIAHKRYEKYGSEVEETENNIAGLMMLFPKRLWDDVGEFPEGGIHVNGEFLDYIFSKRTRRIGGRIGIAKGIYLFHIYREWLDNVRMGYTHIL